MEVKFNEKSSAKANRGFKKRNYYFHPDEDFREDHTWGKTKSAELLNPKPVKKVNLIGSM
ncbi:hypothetical protein [Pedobacter polysacchareus]|uniref:hypothetical protein n=1 Tax=Pedobacter polysacchareus TaxID=2861973 RepID=UPI001C99E76D|nr:hypothetical protein [Pedobacter polysacchareus]